MALLTVDRLHILQRLTGATVRVSLNDYDVTDRCVAADDEHGWAVLHAWDPHGARVVDVSGHTAVVLLVGEVAFVWRVEQKRHAWQWVNLRLAPWVPPAPRTY